VHSLVEAIDLGEIDVRKQILTKRVRPLGLLYATTACMMKVLYHILLI
jgi:hypothetical protein